jgi:tRNA A-37 threonylcarbamoyl transferase component Bud32
LRAYLCQRLGLDTVLFQPLDANGAHASTPLMATGRKRDGCERRYFVKLMSQRNWRASLVARSLRWLQHHGRTEREPILLSLRAEAEYEHYMMLVFAEIGVPAPRSAGLFRLRPGVYALVSEFLEGARSLRGSGVVPVEYVYAALHALRRMRQADCAHCDIKASNMMILPGWRFALVDLATARSNAGKKRLAADLADMLVALALFHEPQGVVEAARDVVGQEALERVLPYLQRRFINTETRKMIPPTLPRTLRALVQADTHSTEGHGTP